jgi:hypothetical protein
MNLIHDDHRAYVNERPKRKSLITCHVDKLRIKLFPLNARDKVYCHPATLIIQPIHIGIDLAPLLKQIDHKERSSIRLAAARSTRYTRDHLTPPLLPNSTHAARLPFLDPRTPPAVPSLFW